MENIKNSCGSEGCDARKLTLPYAEIKRHERFINRVNFNGSFKRVLPGVHERRNGIRKVSFMVGQALEAK
tara:strand:- start:853 stop:1062 length:210 start_codon:yes stop_codon:yes gene_type:complete